MQGRPLVARFNIIPFQMCKSVRPLCSKMSKSLRPLCTLKASVPYAHYKNGTASEIIREKEKKRANI